MESWTEIKISVDAKDIDRASDIANVVVPYGIYIEDYTNLEQEVEDIAHIDLIDEDLLAKDRNKAFVHIYLEPDVSPSEAVAFLSERYNAEGVKHSIELLDCLEEDWRNNWKKYFNPIEVGEKLLIRPSWRDDYDAGNRKVLNIDPGLAFGTGGHETTRLCLEMCESTLKRAILFLMWVAVVVFSVLQHCFWVQTVPSALILTKLRRELRLKTQKLTALLTALQLSVAALPTRLRASMTLFLPILLPMRLCFSQKALRTL